MPSLDQLADDGAIMPGWNPQAWYERVAYVARIATDAGVRTVYARWAANVRRKHHLGDRE